MKRKAIVALIMAAILAIGAVSVFAMDYYVPEDATTVTSRFSLVEREYVGGNEFAMVSEDGELVINITEDTVIYFEDYVPLSDECDGMTQMVREVLFGRTLAEVLDGRNLRVIFVEDEQIEAISIMVLFEIAVALPPEVIDIENGYDYDDYGYIGIVTLPEEINWEDFDFVYPEDFDFDVLVLNGEVVVNNEILENAPVPFLQDDNIVMVPLRVVAEALGYDVSWNGYLRSVQLGVAIHLWIDSTEVHVGRMAPLEISTAAVLVDSVTFVPLDFFRNVLNQTAYVFEGQVVVETYSDMM